MKAYGLRLKKTKEVLGVSSSSNDDADFCTDVTFSLWTHEDNIWMVWNRETAEKACITNNDWYNARYAAPKNDYVGQCEVFEIEIPGVDFKHE